MAALASMLSKFLPEPYGGADLRFLSRQPDTNLQCQTMGSGPVRLTVCLFTPQLSLVLIAPTHVGMARLSWPGWLTTCQDGLPVCLVQKVQRYKKSQKRYISPIRGEAPCEQILTKFCTFGDMLDVIICANFGMEKLRGLGNTGAHLCRLLPLPGVD